MCMDHVWPSKKSPLTWSKRRTPLECNFILWRDTIQKLFCGANGLYPDHLGQTMHRKTKIYTLTDSINFKAVTNQYEERFQALIGTVTYSEDQVWEIITLLKANKLYAGSNGSVKNDQGSHVYGFTDGHKEDNI